MLQFKHRVQVYKNNDSCILNRSNMICSIVIANKTLQNCVKQGSVYLLLCPKQGPKIEGALLPYAGCVFYFFCPKQGQGLKPSAAPLHPTMGQVPPPPPAVSPLQAAMLVPS